MRRHFLLLAVALALAACAPGAAEYTKAEAPNRLQVEGGTSTVAVAFAPGSGRLSAYQGTRLDNLVASGAIGRADRVAVAAAGSAGLAAAREAAVQSRLLRWGIVAAAEPMPGVPANRAMLSVGRYSVTLPPCPNWSEPRANDFTNAPPSNFGCASAVNLGLMAASPADLASGRTLAPAAGKPAAAAVDRWLDDKVALPTEASMGPIGGGGGGGSTGGAPAGAGSQ